MTALRADTSGKLRLLSLDHLDGRTIAAKRARKMRAQLIRELGGEVRLSVAQRTLIDGVAMTTALINDLGARALRGEQIDQNDLVRLTNARRRDLQQLGIERWR